MEIETAKQDKARDKGSKIQRKRCRGKEKGTEEKIERGKRVRVQTEIKPQGQRQLEDNKEKGTEEKLERQKSQSTDRDKTTRTETAGG